MKNVLSIIIYLFLSHLNENMIFKVENFREYELEVLFTYIDKSTT